MLLGEKKTNNLKKNQNIGKTNVIFLKEGKSREKYGAAYKKWE